MKIICLEEHFSTPEIDAAWKELGSDRQDLSTKISTPEKDRLLLDLGDERLRAMDEAGVDVAVLSVTTPGVQNLAPSVAVNLARQANDCLAEAVLRHPDRFGGFATLPTPDPEAAARELERAVCELGLDGAMLNGRTGELSLDHPDFEPLLETAARLRAPLYIHPQSPQTKVRAALYDGLDDTVSTLFATAGLGWHYESGIQALRLMLSGAFHRYPDLQIVLGHWGEVVLFYLERSDLLARVGGLPKKLSDYARQNVYVTPGGILSQRYLRWCLEVVGPERIMCATDYPFPPLEPQGTRRFLQDSGLDPATQTAIASGNWDRLRSQIRR